MRFPFVSASALACSVACFAVTCVMQGCGSDDPAAAPTSTPDSGTSTDGGPTVDAAEAGPPPITLGTCGANTASFRYGRDEPGSILDYNDALEGIAVDGTSIFLAGHVLDRADGGSNAFSHAVVRTMAEPSAGGWERSTTGVSVVRGIAADGQAGVLVVGSGLNNSFPLSTDGFVRRLHANDGSDDWSTSFTGLGTEEAISVAVHGDAVFVAGTFTGTATFGAKQLTSAGGVDVFVAELDRATGSVQDAFKVGGTNDDIVAGIAVDSAGDVVFTGASSNGTHFDGWVAKRSPVGDVRWKKDLGGNDTAQLAGVALDGSGDAYAVGNFKGTIQLGGTTKSRGARDGIVLKLAAATGEPIWTKHWAGDDQDLANAVAVGPDGSILVGGETQSTRGIDYGGGPLGGGINPAVVVVEYDADGTHRCSRVYEMQERQEGVRDDSGVTYIGARANAVAYIGTTSYVVGGAFAQLLDIGAGPMTASGGSDWFAGTFAR